MKKKFIAVSLVLILTLSMGLTAFAAPADVKTAPVKTEATAESPEEASTYAMNRSVYGYAADYTDNEADNFYVNATGSYALTGGATIKSSDFASSTQITYVSIYRPDGSLAVSNVKLTGNQEKVVNFTNAQVGTYTVAYNVGGVNKGWIHCWIY